MATEKTVVTSEGTANATTASKLADDLAIAQAKDPRIGTALPSANARSKVTAENNIGGRTLIDTNQTASPPALADPNKPTLISDLIRPGAPNSTMANTHAEVGLIQQAYDAGLTQGQNMTIVVRGEAVCSFCQQSTNLIAATERDRDISRESSDYGRFATFDDVPNQAFARNELAITSGMKSDVNYVIEVEVIQPFSAQIGIVGPQGQAVGGASQLYFVMPKYQLGEALKFVEGSQRSLP
jgi:hypothetical protein